MTHTYSVLGMTCNGCRSSVEQKLNSIKSVKKATVDLASETAIIEMEQPVGIASLQAVLPKKFSISDIKPKTHVQEVQDVFKATAPENELSKFQQLKPLFLIFGCILLLVLAKNFSTWDVNDMMLDFMGTFFLIFSLFKFFDLSGFATSFSMYDPLAKAVPAYGKVYPFIEAILGFMFLARLEIPVLLIVTIVILVLTSIGVITSLLSKQSIKCACLGTVLKLPMTLATFIENSIMIVMAILLIVKYNLL